MDYVLKSGTFRQKETKSFLSFLLTFYASFHLLPMFNKMHGLRPAHRQPCRASAVAGRAARSLARI